MKPKLSRLARFGLGLGIAGLLVALVSGGLLPGFAVPFGLAAIGIGALAIQAIRKARASQRRGSWAVVGAFLFVMATGMGFLFLVGVFVHRFHQMHRQQQAWHQSRQTLESLADTPISDEPAAHFTSNLPIVVLHTAGRSISHGVQTPVRAQFFDAVNQRASVGAKPAYDGLGTLQPRGHSSLSLPKQSYTFHTVDDRANQTKVSLLGLPAEEDWVLYAPFEDKTMLRDVLAFELASRMGHYAPRTRYVELFIRHSDRPLSMREYAGVYVLMEKIKRGKERVNIAKLTPSNQAEPEISGGYIIKRDHGERSETRFHTGRGGPYFFVSPRGQEITAAQKSWLTRYFNAFESALYGEDFKDPLAGYAAFLDVDAFIDSHWLIEATKNVDGFRYSAFLTKDRGGKLKPGPPWDWNRSFGNANYYGGGQTHGWYWSHLRPNEISWYHRLKEDPSFVRRSAARWLELRKDILATKRIHARIDELADRLEEAQQRNFKRWPVLGQQVTCNHYVGETYQDEVRWLKNWIERRFAWIDSQVGVPSDL